MQDFITINSGMPPDHPLLWFDPQIALVMYGAAVGLCCVLVYLAVNASRPSAPPPTDIGDEFKTAA